MMQVKKMYFSKHVTITMSIIFMLLAGCGSDDDIINAGDDQDKTADPDPDTNPQTDDPVVTIDPEAFYVDQDHSNASDENDGKYVTDGGSGPWKTIQKMLNTLQEGEHGYVRASDSPYIPTEKTSAFDAVGFYCQTSGGDGTSIVIEGYPGERPQIGLSSFDEAKEQYNGASLIGKVYSGFVTDIGVSYVTIRNFEISNLSGSGIFVNPDGEKHGLVFENLYIHNLVGLDNVGGVRLDGCNNCTVKNSIIHDIYSVHKTSNKITDVPFGMDSGIHGYQPAGCTIENNEIYHVEKAIFQKQADEDDGDSHTIRYNDIHDVHKGLVMEIQGSGSPAPLNAEFSNNLVRNVENAISAPLQDVGEQGNGLLIFNNTLINTETIGYTQEITGIEVFNNILHGHRPSWSSNTNETQVYSTGRTDGIVYENGFTYFDNNIYHDIQENWILERDGPDQVNYRSLTDWQKATHAALGLDFKPDQSSQLADPKFTNVLGGDYTLMADSPAKSNGRGGDYSTVIGVIWENHTIGPDWSIDE